MANTDAGGDEDPKRRCVFLARYKKIGVNQWIRVAQPEIDISDHPWPDLYQAPHVTASRENEVEIRVREDAAVNLEDDSLIGDYKGAAERCDEALRRAFPGSVILDDLSGW